MIALCEEVIHSKSKKIRWNLTTYAYQSKEAGIKTLVALDDQGGMCQEEITVKSCFFCPVSILRVYRCCGNGKFVPLLWKWKICAAVLEMENLYCCCSNTHIVPETLFAQVCKARRDVITVNIKYFGELAKHYIKYIVTVNEVLWLGGF